MFAPGTLKESVLCCGVLCCGLLSGALRVVVWVVRCSLRCIVWWVTVGSVLLALCGGVCVVF